MNSSNPAQRGEAVTSQFDRRTTRRANDPRVKTLTRFLGVNYRRAATGEILENPDRDQHNHHGGNRHYLVDQVIALGWLRRSHMLGMEGGCGL